jgi:PAS domain S-box-containing protein
MSFNISRILQRKAFVVLIIAIIVIFALLTWWTVLQAHREMISNLLLQTRLLAETINHHHVKTLGGSGADLKNPVYIRLKEQFAAARQLNDKYRFLYLVGRRADGKIFFFLDSEPIGAADESPPGQIYDEATDKWGRVFQTGQAHTEGPVTDRWGTFFSSMMPVVDPATNKVIAVLGIDIDAGDWKLELARTALAPALFALALIVILLAGTIFLARRNRMADKAPRWMNYFEPTLAALFGLVLTIFAAWLLHESERRDRNGIFQQLAESRTLIVAKELQNIRNYDLEGLARFYQGSEYVTYKEYIEYTGFLANNPAVQAWEWIPIVPAAQKNQFEEAARASGLKGFEIWQKDKKGARIPVTKRSFYYPVYYVAPLAGNESALGYDLGSEPLRHAAMIKAAHTGLVTATEPITLVQKPGNQKGLLIFHPVFKDKGSRHLKGFVLAVLRMGKLLENIGPNILTTQMEISLLFPDGTNVTLATNFDDGQPQQGGPFLTRPVFAYGKVFGVKSYADNAFLDAYPPRAAFFTTLAGLMLTVALTFLLGMTIRGRSTLEKLVQARTMELRESETLYRKIFADPSAVKLLIDPDTADIIDANQAAEKFYGWPREKLKQMKISDINTLSPEEIKQEMDKARTRKKIYFEFRHRLADGSIRDVEVYSSRIKVKENELLHSVIHDVTERKRAEDALHESQKRQQEYTNLLSELIGKKDFISGDLENNIRLITELSARLLKTGRVSVWTYNNDYSRIQCVDLYEISKGKHRKGEILRSSEFPDYTASHKAGRVIAVEDVFSDARTSSIPSSYYEDHGIKSLLDAPVWVQDRLVALLSFESVGDKRRWLAQEESIALTLAAYVALCYEAAERKQAEEEVRKLSKELEQRVNERTKELHDSQLALLNVVDDLNESAKKLSSANQALEALNKELEAFAYSVSHDLRAPLRNIDGFSAALLEDYKNKLDATGKNYLTRVRHASQNMGELIDDILKLSRVGKSEFRPGPVNLSEMVKKIVNDCRKTRGGMAIKTKIRNDIVVTGDAALLQIALANLIDNAFKFSSKQKSPLVEFGAKQEDRQNVFYVRDNGVGFDMTYASKLFAPFQRLHNLDEFPGTGVGLATVQRIIHRHGGHIWAEGEVNKGATFFFTIPEG